MEANNAPGSEYRLLFRSKSSNQRGCMKSFVNFCTRTGAQAGSVARKNRLVSGKISYLWLCSSPLGTRLPATRPSKIRMLTLLNAKLLNLFVGHRDRYLILYANAHPWDEVTMQGRDHARCAEVKDLRNCEEVFHY